MELLSNNIDAELKIIDDRISAHRDLIRNLGAERRRLLEKKKDLDMDVVLQCIEEKGLSSNEVLILLNNAKE